MCWSKSRWRSNAKDIAQLIAARDRKKVLVCEAFMVDLPPAMAQGARTGRVGRDRHAAPRAGRLHLFQRRPDQHAQHARRSAAARCPTSASIRRSRRASSPARSRSASRRRSSATRSSAPTSIPRSGPISATSNCPSISRPRWPPASSWSSTATRASSRCMRPFNAGLYDHHRVELHNQNHTEETVFRFPGAQQYRLQVEAFARAAQGRQGPGLHAGELGEEPEGHRRDLPRRRQRRLGEGVTAHRDTGGRDRQ